MGLDMHLYKLSKPTYTDSTSYFNKEHVEEEKELYSETFLKFAELTKKKNQYYDLEKINNTFGVKVKYVGMVGPEGVGFTCEEPVPDEHRNDKNFLTSDTTLFISHEDLENYLYEQEDDMYAIDFESIDYQRKGLNDVGWNLIPENLSYSDDKDTIMRMVMLGGLSTSFLENWVEGETVFHPWW